MYFILYFSNLLILQIKVLSCYYPVVVLQVIIFEAVRINNCGAEIAVSKFMQLCGNSTATNSHNSLDNIECSHDHIIAIVVILVVCILYLQHLHP